MFRRLTCGVLLVAVLTFLGGCGRGAEDKINLPQSGKPMPTNPPEGTAEPD
jgi:hypothetical protein